jgi:Family of unknown function (DUF5678)
MYQTESGRTPDPKFESAEGTSGRAAGGNPPSPFDPPGLGDWFASEEAARHSGRWVLLTDDYRVIAAARTPKELLDIHPEIQAPFIVYVDPANIRVAM